MRRTGAVRAIPIILAMGAAAALTACGSGGENKAGGAARSAGITVRLHSASPNSGAPGAFAPGPTFGAEGHGGFSQWSITSGLVDASGKPAGQYEVSCTTSPRRGATNCVNTYQLLRGQIVEEGVENPPFGSGGTLAVVGGTGAYEGARGTAQTIPGVRGAGTFVIHFVPGAGHESITNLRATPVALARGVLGQSRKTPYIQWSYTNDLRDGAGRIAGREQTVCTSSPRKGIATCSVTLVLPRGEVNAVGVLDAPGPRGGTIPVSGGTGSYEGVRGSLQTSGASGKPQSVVLHLLSHGDG